MKHFVHLLIFGSLLVSTARSFTTEKLKGSEPPPQIIVSYHPGSSQKALPPLTNLVESEEGEEEFEEESFLVEKEIFLSKINLQSNFDSKSNYGYLYFEPEKRPPRKEV